MHTQRHYPVYKGGRRSFGWSDMERSDAEEGCGRMTRPGQLIGHFTPPPGDVGAYLTLTVTLHEMNNPEIRGILATAQIFFRST